MYRIDHLAFRTLNRVKSVKFFKEAMGYVEQAEFEIYFNDEKTDKAMCTALQPHNRSSDSLPWTMLIPITEIKGHDGVDLLSQEYVLSPEIFVSEGTTGSIVHDWCLKHNNGGLHHIALQVPDNSTVEAEMEKWLKNSWCEGFSSETVMKCDGLNQIFTKPSELVGVVFELIKRENAGFCRDSVKSLMQSTKGD